MTNDHVFSQIPTSKMPRSIFKRPFNLKTTIGTDYLYPIYCDEALPGDTFKFNQNLFGRLSTPVVPVMDTLYLDTFYFAVPIRLIDDNWVKLMGERPFGDTTTVYEVPQLTAPASGVAPCSLSDYLGIPPLVGGLKFSSYWHRAYNLIYNEWFRDENLCTPRPIGTKNYDGTTITETLNNYTLCKRGKRHDYFTSCLPWPAKGSPVTIGVGSVAPVVGTGTGLMLTNNNRAGYLTYAASPSMGDGNAVYIKHPATPDWPYDNGTLVSSSYGWNRLDTDSWRALGVSESRTLGISGLVADISQASSITINALREAFAIQSLLELDSRGGTRYTEIIRAHFSITSPDARMQRPEYLGGSSKPLNVTTVPQTSGTSADSETPQGNLSAFVTAKNDVSWVKSFTEHCIILGLACVRADLSYQQGLPRMFSRRTRYDFYWPELANLGEQAVLNKEIYAQGTSDDDGVFGYQERWAEYRYHPNMITGLFRSQVPLSLDVWHLAQKFDSLPTLSSQFIEEKVPIERIVAVQDEPPLILDGWFDVRCARPMPLYSVPGLGRRF